MKLKSGHTTSVQCILFTIEWGNLCQTSEDARKIGALPVSQRNAIRMAFWWRADSGPRFGSDWVYSPIIYQIKTSYEGRSICNENSKVYSKVLYLLTSKLLSLKGMFLG